MEYIIYNGEEKIVKETSYEIAQLMSHFCIGENGFSKWVNNKYDAYTMLISNFNFNFLYKKYLEEFARDIDLGKYDTYVTRVGAPKTVY